MFAEGLSIARTKIGNISLKPQEQQNAQSSTAKKVEVVHKNCWLSLTWPESIPHCAKMEIIEFASFEKESCTECDRTFFQRRVEARITFLLLDHETRKGASDTSVKALGTGFWYGNEYRLQLLKHPVVMPDGTTSPQPALTALQANGAFYHGRPPVGMELVSDPSSATGKAIGFYTLKQGVDATTALANFHSKFCFIDCCAFLQLAFYETLLDFVTPKNFNAIFHASGGTPFNIGPGVTITSLQWFLEVRELEQSGKVGCRPIPEGGWTQFSNLPVYSTLHPLGDAGGYFVSRMQTEGEERFRGFGLPREGVTELQIYDIFAVECGEPTLPITEFVSNPVWVKNIKNAPVVQVKGDKRTVQQARQEARELEITRDIFLEMQETSTMKIFSGFLIQPNVQSIKNAIHGKANS